MMAEQVLVEPEKLREVNERLDNAVALEEIARALRDDGRGVIRADGIALILRDGDFCHYFEEDAIGPLWKGRKFPMAACISGWSMLKRQTVCIADIRIDKRIPYNLYESTFVRSLVIAPVEKNPPVGALGAYWSRLYAASAEEVAGVEALAKATGAAILRLQHQAPTLRSIGDNQQIVRALTPTLEPL